MGKAEILVVEDNRDTLNLLAYNLKNAGYEVATSMDGADALDKVKSLVPDMVVLDIMLPGMDGFEICREMKKDPRTSHVPVIMLTARGEEVDRIVGLELGADDYVVKPFSPRELLLRIQAVLRRKEPTGDVPGVWTRDGLSVDFEAHAVFVDGEQVPLTATEFRLLGELIRNKGKVQTRDRLLETVWGWRFEGYARTVDTHIRRLRQKIGDHAGLIETVRGVGYRFRAD